MQETESNSSYNKWWAFLVVRIQEGSKGDRQTWLMHKTRNHRTPGTLSLELDPGWLLGLGSWSQAMFNRVQTKPNQTSAVRKQYMLLPILLKPPYLPLSPQLSSALWLPPRCGVPAASPLRLVMTLTSHWPHPCTHGFPPHIRSASSLPAVYGVCPGQVPKRESDWFSSPHIAQASDWLAALGSGGTTRPISSDHWDQVTW